MKDRWSQLSMSEKSDLMSLYIRNGISSLEEIKKHYNSFATGGQMNTDGHLFGPGGPVKPWERSIVVPGTTPETSDNSVNYSPQAENTTFKQAVRRQAEVNAKVQGRKSPNQQDFNIAYGQLTRQEDAPIEQNFNPITGERQYTKEEQDLMRAQGAGLLTEGLFWALDPIGMAGYSLMDKSPRLFNSNNTLTENLEQEGISPVVAPFIVGGLGSGLTNGISKGVQSAIDRNLQKQLSRVIELDKGLLNIKNEAHNRFRLGDVEINDPNLMYRQTDGRALGEVASGGNRHTMFNRGSLWYGIPTESMLNPVIEPKTVGKLKLTKPNSEVAKTHLLVTRNADMTGVNQKFGIVSIGPHSESSLHLNIEKSPEDRWLNEMIREWRNKNSEPGVATYVTDGGSRRVPLEGALNNSNTSIYTFDSGYGYRRIQEPTPTLEQAVQEAEDAYVRNNPLAFVHEIEDMQLLNTIREFNGRRGSPSLGISRFDANGNAYTGYGNIRFYFPKDYIKGLKSYSWSDDALLPTTSDAIREAERRGIELKYTEDGEALISPELESQLKIELLKDHPHLNKRDKNLETSIKNIRAINSPSHYGEVYPLEPVDLSKALYVQTSETYPTLTNWLKLNGIQYGTKVPAILDKRVTFKNGGKLD